MNNPALLKAYSEAIRQKGKTARGKKARGLVPSQSQPLYPINQGGLGAFPYRWEIPTGFNDYTYLFCDHGFTLDRDSGILSAQGIYHNQYLSVLKAIDFKLSSADKMTLNQAHTLREQVISIVVNAYTESFGPISTNDLNKAKHTLGYSIDSKFDYITLYVIANVWSGSQVQGVSPIDLKKWANSLDPFSELKAVPVGKERECRSIVNEIVTLLLGASELLELVNLRGQSVEVLKTAISSIQNPTNKNGAICTIDNNGFKTLLPAWEVSPFVKKLETNLRKGRISSELKMTVKLDGIGSVTVSINDGKSIKVSADPLLLINEDGQEFHPLSITGAGSVYFSSKIFKGRTTVSFTPEAVSDSQSTGWEADNIIKQAIANGPKDVTGYYFVHNPNVDFTSEGSLGRLVQLEISQYPSINIYYQEGNITDFLNHFPVTQKWNLSWLGLPKPENDNFSYSAKVIKNDSGFTVQLNPDPALPNTGSLRDMVYVIGGKVRWLK